MGYPINNYNLLPMSSQFVYQIHTHTVCKEDILKYTVANKHKKSSSRGSGPERHLYIHTSISVHAYTPYLRQLAGGSGFYK